MFTNPDAIASWERLQERLDGHDQMPRWAAAEPALTRVEQVADLPGLVLNEPDPGRRDELLIALVRLAAHDGGDDSDAVLVVLHLLLPGASRLARHLAPLCGDASLSIRPLDLVLGELTLMIGSYPWRQRPVRVAANLLFGAKKSLLRGELREAARRRSPAPHDSSGSALVDQRTAASGWWAGTSMAGRPVFPPAPDEDEGSVVELLDLMMWAHRTGVADAADLALLVDLAQAQADGPGGRLRVAQQRRINERTLRRRRDLTLCRLQAAAGDYLRACA